LSVLATVRLEEWLPTTDPEDLAAILAAMPTGQSVSILAIDHKSGKTGYLAVTLP